MKKLLILIAATTLVAFKFPNERFVAKDKGFSIAIPEGYEMKKDYDQMIPVMMLSPMESDKDNFRENINVATEPFVGSSSSYSLANLNEMKTALTDFNLLKTGTKQVGDLTAYWFVYTFSYKEFKMQNLVYCFAFNGNGYGVTCSASTETFDKYKKIFEETAESFKKE